jgi:xylulokinase
VVLVGGLARSPLVRRIVAGVVRQPLLPLASAEQSALGSALLAAVHVGFFTSLDEACGVAVHYEAPVEPVSADAARYEQLYAQYRGVYPLLRETMPFVQGAARK